MKILIAGSDFNSKLLAQFIKLQSGEHDIYITSDDFSDNEYYTPIGIKENDIASIIDFVKNNEIDFTVSLSKLAIINGIADEFKNANLLIFAPYSEAARITYFNSIAKKVFYKLKINTPKFGIFDRENLAVDYIRNSKFPIIISNDFTLMEYKNETYYSFSKAKEGIQKLFEDDNEKIIIESYSGENPLYVYFITDGYNALPLICAERTHSSIQNENHHGENNVTEIIAPSTKFSENMYVKVLQRVIYPILDDITKYSDNYMGIIGLKIEIKNEDFKIIQIFNGFQNYDFVSLIPLLDVKLIDVLYDCANGCLADNYDFIKLNEKYSYTIVTDKKNIINRVDNDEEFIECEDNSNYILNSSSYTLNHAKEKLNEYLDIVIKEKSFE